MKLARTLDIDDQDINLIISEYPDNVGQQAMVMLRWEISEIMNEVEY